MDNNFFSLSRNSDWLSGQLSNVSIINDEIRITASRRYIYENTVKLQTIDVNNSVKACAIGSNGRLYYLDNNYMIRMYDIDTRVSELVCSKVYNFSEMSLHYANSHLYVQYSNTQVATDIYKEKYSVVDIISVDTGIVENSIQTLDNEMFCIKAFSVDNIGNIYLLNYNGILYCINGLLNINDKYNLNTLLNKNINSYIPSSIILKGSNNEFIYLYDRNSNEFLTINLISKQVDAIPIENISSIAVRKDYVLINKEENIKSAIYRYDRNNKLFEKLPFLAGKSDDIEFDNQAKIYIYNYSSDTVTIMCEKEGINFNVAKNAYEGIYYTKIFDSNKEGITWDKVSMEADIPANCMISVSYIAFDDFEIYFEDKSYMLTEFIQNKEIPLEKKELFMNNRWQGKLTNFNKALFRNATGRFLVMKVELWGNNIKTPAINKMRVFYDRQTYLKYLPELYSDENSDSFLGRYLSLFESFMQDIEEKIDYISDNFDADKASSEMLRWLCKWLDIDVDFTWSDEKIRKLIKRAPYIYKRRGTKEAISEILEIYLGVKPIIVENFQLDYIRENEEMAGLINSLYSNNTYSFTILVKLTYDLSDDEKITIEKILDNESPAYCKYKFIVLEPWMALDKHTYLGINTQILNWSGMRLDGKSILPYNAILTDKKL